MDEPRTRDCAAAPALLPVNVMLTYDSARAGCRAMEVVQRMVERLGCEFLFNLRLWRMDHVALPHAQRQVGRDAAQTDIIIVACSDPDRLPRPFLEWLERWAGEHSGSDTAMAALPVDPAAGDPASQAFAGSLQRLAGKHGLDFLSADTTVADAGAFDELRRFRHADGGPARPPGRMSPRPAQCGR